MKGNKSFRIVVAERFSPESLARLQGIAEVNTLPDTAPDTMIAALDEADALLIRTKAHVTARIIDAAPRLKVIGRASLNADHIDLRAARQRNISVVYAPHVAVASTAEFALALILALRRRVPFLDQQIRAGKFEALRTPQGREMRHETIGLLGLSPVAEHLGRLCSTAFGSTLIYHDPAGQVPTAFEGRSIDLDTLLATADVLSVHLPLTPETRGLLNAERIAKLKPTAIIVNTSRGQVVDTLALTQALRKRLIAGAALDVFEIEPLPGDHPLRRAPNCLLTPHVAGATEDASAGRFDVIDDVVRVLRGLPPMHPATLPCDKEHGSASSPRAETGA